MDRSNSIAHKKHATEYRLCNSEANPCSPLINTLSPEEDLSAYCRECNCLDDPPARSLMHVIESFRHHAVDGVVSEIAHELNQPLTAISIVSDTALRMLTAEQYSIDEIKRSLVTIDLQARRASEVIKSLTNFSSGNVLEKQTISINTIVNEVVELIEIEAKWNCVKLDVVLEDKCAELSVDRVLIEQVLLNLSRNAIEAMKCIKPEKRNLCIFTQSINDEIVVNVRDSGTGMTSEQGQQAFNAFYSSKPGGMGLGLVISQSIIKAHGGDLCFSSLPDNGCIFYFTLGTSK